MDRCDPAAPVMRGVNSPLFIGGALIRDPRAVPNLCKADSGLSAMFGILAATEKKSAHDSDSLLF